jgi:hypothetical protein
MHARVSHPKTFYCTQIRGILEAYTEEIEKLRATVEESADAARSKDREQIRQPQQ